MSSLDQETFSGNSYQEQPVILVVTRNSNLTEATMNYSLNVAGRLHRRILVAYVNTMPFLRGGIGRRERFAQSVSVNIAKFKAKGEGKPVSIAHVKESGKIGKVVSRLCRIVKRIDFIIVDEGVRIEEVVARSPVPVFNVDRPLQVNQWGNNERRISAGQNVPRHTL